MSKFIELKMVAGGAKAIAEKIGGAAPEWIQIFPDGEYPCFDGTYYCNADDRAKVIAKFAERGNPAVIDYEHQTLTGEEAPAAGWVTELADRGAEGLWGKVEWTARAREYLGSGEYRFDSPVFDVNKKTNHIMQLHHLALTNHPGSNNRTPLTEQIAASVRARRITRQTREGVMDELMERLQYFLSLPITATHNDARTALQKIIEAIPADDQMLILAEKAGDAKTLSQVFGIGSSKDDAKSNLVAAKALLDELELPENATVAQAHARIGELKSAKATNDAVETLRGELKTAKARITELEAKTVDEKISALIESNRKKVTPAKEQWIRSVAKKYGYDHAVEVMKNLKEELPDSTAAGENNQGAAELQPVAQTMRVGGKDVPVDPEAATRLQKVQAIQKENPEKFGDFAAAADELRRRESAKK